MKTVAIYHEAVSKLVFMKISFIVKIIVYLRNNRRRQNIIMYRQSHRSSWKL